jgi:uncharacterized protein YegL
MTLRRVTLLLDRSTSMDGTPVGQAGAFIQWTLISLLKANRHLYGQVELGLVAFDCSAEWLVRYSDAETFAFPSVLEIAPFGGSSLGSALGLLEEDIGLRGDSEEDLIMLISDGNFLDDVAEVTERFSEKSKALRISLGVDASFRHALAHFERWPAGGRRAAGEVSGVTAQELEAWFAKI